MLTMMLNSVQRFVDSAVQAIRHRVARWTKPANSSLISGTVVDLTRSKAELVVENTLLRQQLIVLQRTVKRPRVTSTDRALSWLHRSSVGIRSSYPRLRYHAW